jgi:hypothetical protein
MWKELRGRAKADALQATRAVAAQWAAGGSGCMPRGWAAKA